MSSDAEPELQRWPEPIGDHDPVFEAHLSLTIDAARGQSVSIDVIARGEEGPRSGRGTTNFQLVMPEKRSAPEEFLERIDDHDDGQRIYTG